MRPRSPRRLPSPLAAPHLCLLLLTLIARLYCCSLSTLVAADQPNFSTSARPALAIALQAVGSSISARMSRAAST